MFTQGQNPSNTIPEHYGILNMPTHGFTSLKVISYTNLPSGYNAYPSIDIGGTAYGRPAIGTVFDISGKSLRIIAFTIERNYSQSGITVELS